ncbi:MAG TPA: hypothetical protein VF939_19735 [Puia sp.]
MESEREEGIDPLAADQEEQEQAVLKPAKVMELLKVQGIVINYAEAELVGQLLHQLSNIIVSKFLQNEQDR